MTEPKSANRRLILSLCGIALAASVWFVIGSGRKAQDLVSGVTVVPAKDTNFHSSDADGPSRNLNQPPDTPATPAAPDYHIPESGRISIEADALPTGQVLTLGLALADEARGDEPLAVRVVSVDGRVLEITALPMNGKGGGVQLGIDADWLLPGNYMIQIKTVERTQFPLRRYVLVVQ